MEQRKNARQRIEFTSVEFLSAGFAPAFSVIIALAIGAVILLASNRDPVAAYEALIRGAFGDIMALGDTLARATPIIFTGLAVAFAFRCGLFNIGVEGQLLIGALAAACTGHFAKGLPAFIHLPVTLIAAALAAGLWAALPGVLKALRGVHEVITTIMMNYIAYSFTAYAIETLRTGVAPKTPRIQPSAELPLIGGLVPGFAGSSLNAGFFLALVSCGLVYFILAKTVLGYEIRAVGFNPLAAEDAGIKVPRNIILAMVISGMLAGLGGAERALGVHYAFVSGISPGYGFEGIAVALLANNNPFGIILSGILFGALASGGLYMDMSADVPSDIIIILQALIIFFVAANTIVRTLLFRRKRGDVTR